MLNTDASTGLTMNNDNSSSENSGSRRRQRDVNTSSSTLQRQPHHVMTQPVFLRLIFPFVPTKSLSTPLLFNSVSTSWSETIQHYSGAQLCWNALIRSSTVEDGTADDDDDARNSVDRNDFIADQFNQLLHCVMTVRNSFSLVAAFDTMLMLPDETAKAIVAEMDSDFINREYSYTSSSLQAFEQMFSVVERVEGADALKTLLDKIDIEYVVKRSYSIVAHYFDTLKRLGVDWKTFFSEENSDSNRFVCVVIYSESVETLKVVIDICRGVSDDFLKLILEKQHKTDCWNESSQNYYYWRPMNFAFHKKHLAGEFVQILLNTMKGLYHTTSEMFNRRVFTSGDFIHVYDRKISARDPLIKILVNASGVEQLFDTTSSTPLQFVMRNCVEDGCIRSVIDRCRELGGNELVRKQLETAGLKDKYLPFTYSFSSGFRKTVVQYLLEYMKGIGMDFLRKQLWAKAGSSERVLWHGEGSSYQLEFIRETDGNTFFLAACKQNLRDCRSCSE